MRIFSGNSEGVRWEDFQIFDELSRFDTIPEISLTLFMPICSALLVYKMILNIATISLCVKEYLELFSLLKSKDDAKLNYLHFFYQSCLQIAQFLSYGSDAAF